MENFSEKAIQFVELMSEFDYVQEAFYDLVGRDLIYEGYVDCRFILNIVAKTPYYNQLKGSPFQKLYARGCIPSENVDIMFRYINEMLPKGERIMSELEERALLNWFFLPYISISKNEERKEFFKGIVRTYLDSWGRELLNTMSDNMEETNGILYLSNRCDIHMVNKVSRFVEDVANIREQSKGSIYFRGHSRISYKLLPSIKREASWLENESKMYQELIIKCSNEFRDCKTHLEYLVKMQHYGLPTRLLDITENPLVALYFAVCSNKDLLGEVIILQTEDKQVKYPMSDSVAILAALPMFGRDFHKKLEEAICKGWDCSSMTQKIANEVKSKNPAFEPRIKVEDLTTSFFVVPHQDNQRIIKQDGAFIICGLNHGNEEYDDYILRSLKYKDARGKKQIFIIQNKKKIEKELDMLSINKAGLFPEIDDVAEYIKEKYSVR